MIIGSKVRTPHSVVSATVMGITLMLTLGKRIIRSRVVAVTAAMMLAAHAVHAADLVSSIFASTNITSNQDIDLTGPKVVDWGYYTNKNYYTDPSIDNRKASSGIGAVTVVKGQLNNPNTATTLFTVTFDDGVSPVASNNVSIGARFGGWASNEDRAATFTFNDLGEGTLTVRVYVGHGSNDRIFDMDYSVTATDGNLSGNTLSNSSSGGGALHSAYEIVFATTDASADLILQFNSTSGSEGTSGWIGGFVVERAVTPPKGTVIVVR